MPTLGADQRCAEAQIAIVGADPSGHPKGPATPNRPPDGQLVLIRHLGRTYEDLQKLRKAHQARRGALMRATGMKLPADPVEMLLKQAEHQARLELKRLWRRHPLAPWAKTVRGLGELLMARLIAEIGDPATRATVSQVWAYCGLDPDRRRRKGMSQEEALACGNPRAKTICWLIAESMVIAGSRQHPDPDLYPVKAFETEKGVRYPVSPFGEVYHVRRASTRASARGWPLDHSNNDALRIVAKEFLKQLWIASRQTRFETQNTDAGGNS